MPCTQCYALYKLYFRLTRVYWKHADRLRQTGEGVENNDSSDQEGQERVLDFYIPGSGPTGSTPAFAVNVWGELSACFKHLNVEFIAFLEQIKQAFPFFPCLHAIFATRLNVTPICVTTALGPNGHSTVWYQPPDNMIDPALHTCSDPGLTRGLHVCMYYI